MIWALAMRKDVSGNWADRLQMLEKVLRLG